MGSDYIELNYCYETMQYTSFTLELCNITSFIFCICSTITIRYKLLCLMCAHMHSYF